ncbi:Transforming growth factor-beta receptor-associated protein 1 [Geodia barretti]|nr:Transforming growth factor-beta receptor-associated protein 1 [Geodia barretti]
MNMSTLELYDTGQRIQKLNCYCINESKSHQSSAGPFEVIVAPQRRKQIQKYTLSGERFGHVKDYSIPEPAHAMARDGNSVCVALSGQDGKYVIINIHEGNMFDILSYEPGSTPFVRRMGKGEFLVNAGSFGITTTISGISNRPPVEWGSEFPPKAATYVFPYIVAWSQEAEVIRVFNLIHQKCVQEIPFNNGRYMSELSGKLYAARDKSIYLLSAMPLKEQVNDLLERELVEEAVLLAETVGALEASKNPSAAVEYMNAVKLKAAFIYLATGSFSQAETLLHESGCDPREVIVLFEGLLPQSSTFQPVASHLHSLPSIQAIAEASEGGVVLREAKKFLIRYLKEVRTTQLALGRREDIDTSLVKLLAEDHSASLVPYITNHDLHLSFDETKQALEDYKCYHALALLYYYSNQTNEALGIWTRIYDKQLSDSQFPGFSYIIEFLSKCGIIEVVLQYAKWALDRNQEVGVKIFTERLEGEKSKQLEPPFLLEYLKPYPDATLLYLEYLVNDRNSTEESFHTQLASSYLRQLLGLREETSAPDRELKRARVKLQGFLESSTRYNPACLLSEVVDTDMYRECSVLYGRMEEHEKALSLLVHKLRDYPMAQEYCEEYSKGKGRVYRQNLYQTLLRVYLQPQDRSDQKILITPALSLLNAHGAQFDAAQVLELLPHDWPVTTVKAFLLRSIRGSMDTHRTGKIEYNLSRGENLRVREQYISLQGDPIVITDNTRCPVCNLPFSDAAFVRYPNGVITHLKCGRNKTICPVTGTWFGKV